MASNNVCVGTGNRDFISLFHNPNDTIQAPHNNKGSCERSKVNKLRQSPRVHGQGRYNLLAISKEKKNQDSSTTGGRDRDRQEGEKMRSNLLTRNGRRSVYKRRGTGQKTTERNHGNKGHFQEGQEVGRVEERKRSNRGISTTPNESKTYSYKSNRESPRSKKEEMARLYNAGCGIDSAYYYRSFFNDLLGGHGAAITREYGQVQPKRRDSATELRDYSIYKARYSSHRGEYWRNGRAAELG